jgi:hypothetical protein
VKPRRLLPQIVAAAGAIGAAVLVACGGGGSEATPAALPSQPPAAVAFNGNVLLGAPTFDSVRVSVLSAEQSGTVSIAFGTASGSYERRTASYAVQPGQPLALLLDGLAPDSRYFYRLEFKPAAAAASSASAEYRFQTARPAGSRFVFTVQADSHLDENSDLDLYRRTLANVAADAPDFHIDLGDTFMTEKHAEPLSATARPVADAASANARYAYERGNFALVTHSVPLFLVNGNHDAEVGWLNDGTAANLAVWATQARQRYFLNPAPGAFYSSDSFSQPFVGQRASWYAWQWGDALFVVLDPYWNSPAQPNRDGWNLTLGEAQYRWLAQTLSGSQAVYKFVFVHSLVGGLDGQMRGGAEAAPYFEWGGRNLDGTDGFAARRPGWNLPIHALLVANRVTAVFHGHDHLYAHQSLDGIVYQEVPQPSAVNSASGPNLAREYHYASGTILSSSGHLRVTVAPEGVKAEYVRAWLPRDETTQRRNAQVDHTWTVAAPAK